jgi:hypothetical protein
MNDPVFHAAMTNVETLLRAARSAGETGDYGAVSAELVRAALTIGTQIGILQARYAGSYERTPQAKTIEKALRGLQATAVRAFARAEEVREAAPEPTPEPIGPTLEHQIAYSENGMSEYLP